MMQLLYYFTSLMTNLQILMSTNAEVFDALNLYRLRQERRENEVNKPVGD